MTEPSASDPSYQTLSVRRDGHVAIVALEKPTMPPQMFRDVGAAFTALADDDELRAVVLQSNVKPFTYGLDLQAAFAEMGAAFSGGNAKQRMDLFKTIRSLQAAFDTLSSCPVPVVAAVHGWCIGGGIDLISAADVRLASQDARFSVRETKIAIVADVGTLQRLPPIIGQGNTRELAFTGKDISAERAERMGLVGELFADREAVQAAALAMAQEIAQNAPLTVRGVKQVLNFGADKSIDVGLGFVAAWNSAFLASEDLGEAVAAFMEKRPPAYKGR